MNNSYVEARLENVCPSRVYVQYYSSIHCTEFMDTNLHLF
jgi:hypothetical protein